MPVRYSRQTFNVSHVPCRIANAFAVDRACILVDQLFNIFRLIGRSEARTDSTLRKM